jgi:uncharacterized membrane protein YraQ (UPF0718 family)
LPAFFIAGAIAVFIRQEFFLRYLGSKAKKYISYSIASVSGAILAVCSCTILPLFAGIRSRGAGLGPAITFSRQTRKNGIILQHGTILLSVDVEKMFFLKNSQ